MRIFLSFLLPEDFKRKISEEIREFKNYFPQSVNWVSEDNLHITFQFIGEISSSKLADLDDMIDKSLSSFTFPTSFEVTGLEPFPRRNPRYICVMGKFLDRGVEKALSSFHKQLNDSGIKVDKKSFNPHITLARTKFELNNYEIKRVLSRDFYSGVIDISSLAMVESNLSKRGAVYRILKEY